MKLLFDQNISFRIVKKLQDFYPLTAQVRELGLEGKSDKEIWEFAKKNNFTIVTFDADFADIANVKGIPPKIIWLRFGNTTTKNIAEILCKDVAIIKSFIKDKEYAEIACLEID